MPGLEVLWRQFYLEGYLNLFSIHIHQRSSGDGQNVSCWFVIKVLHPEVLVFPCLVLVSLVPVSVS